MIHYHGTPITPSTAAADILRGRHALVPFSDPRDIELVSEVCSSFIIDNGAFTLWKRGRESRRQLDDWNDYIDFLAKWAYHPGCDFVLIPDIIDGTEDENYELIDDFCNTHAWLVGQAVPVYHLHESLEHFERLCSAFSRVALGSSGQYAQVGSALWWDRMDEVMQLATVPQIWGPSQWTQGQPRVKLHGLRMLDARLLEKLPLSSGDSTNLARNIGIDSAWRGTYQPPTKAWRGSVLAARIESHQSASCYTREVEEDADPQLELVESMAL